MYIYIQSSDLSYGIQMVSKMVWYSKYPCFKALCFLEVAIVVYCVDSDLRMHVGC